MDSRISPKDAALESLTPQSEDYLETIAELQKRDRVARAKDIAERAGVTRGTVTSALKSLHQKGLINYQPYSHVTLTATGEELAEAIINRHETLTEYFATVLQIPRDRAEANACRAEHVLDPEVIERMTQFIDFLVKCPRTSQVWRRAFEQFCAGGQDASDCRECVGQCLARLRDQQA